MNDFRITIEKLRRVKRLMHLTRLASDAGIKPPTLYAKLERGTPLTDKEVQEIERVLRENGVVIL